MQLNSSHTFIDMVSDLVVWQERAAQFHMPQAHHHLDQTDLGLLAAVAMLWIFPQPHDWQNLNATTA